MLTVQERVNDRPACSCGGDDLRLLDQRIAATEAMLEGMRRERDRMISRSQLRFDEVPVTDDGFEVILAACAGILVNDPIAEMFQAEHLAMDLVESELNRERERKAMDDIHDGGDGNIAQFDC